MEKTLLTPIKISIDSKNLPHDLESCLSMVFWKEPEMVAPAAAFMSYVREWSRMGSPHKASDWKKYCAKSGLTQSQYSNMLKRLKRCGMVEKRFNRAIQQHEIVPSEKFQDIMRSAANAWGIFLKQ